MPTLTCRDVPHVWHDGLVVSEASPACCLAYRAHFKCSLLSMNAASKQDSVAGCAPEGEQACLYPKVQQLCVIPCRDQQFPQDSGVRVIQGPQPPPGLGHTKSQEPITILHLSQSVLIEVWRSLDFHTRSAVAAADCASQGCACSLYVLGKQGSNIASATAVDVKAVPDMLCRLWACLHFLIMGCMHCLCIGVGPLQWQPHRHATAARTNHQTGSSRFSQLYTMVHTSSLHPVQQCSAGHEGFYLPADPSTICCS